MRLIGWLATTSPDPPEFMRDELFMKLALMRRLANGNIVELIARQKHVYLQRIHDLAQMERRARVEQQPDLLLLVKGAIIHTEADIKRLDVCLEEKDTLESHRDSLKDSHSAKPQEGRQS